MPKGILSMIDSVDDCGILENCEDLCECMDCDSPCFCFTGGSGGGGDE